jgi:hypothetical protein
MNTLAKRRIRVHVGARRGEVKRGGEVNSRGQMNDDAQSVEGGGYGATVGWWEDGGARGRVGVK